MTRRKTPGATGKADVHEFVKTKSGQTMLDLLRDFRAGEADGARLRMEREAQEAIDRGIDAALAAEGEALKQAGLLSCAGSDAEGYIPVRYWRQPVFLVNTKAHPISLVSTALARAERARAFARVLEQSELVTGDSDLEAGSSTITRMIEEVVELLRVLSEHSGIINAPVSTMNAV